jgi:4-alpha-glucanotransferase
MAPTFDFRARQAGVLLHPTSLPGPHGIGDLGPAAYHFVDWLVSSGQSIWQWLPTTPVGPGDSPYQSPSAFAGSPLMVAFEPLIDKGWMTTPRLPEGGLSDGAVDFRKVIPWRQDALRVAYAGFKSLAKPTDRAAFLAWCEREAEWLDEYALFTALHTTHHGAPWWTWEPSLGQRQPQALAAARKAHADEVEFWRFVQWCFDWQIQALKAYANARGVYFMGDLPIFVADNSADVWSRPDLYDLNDDHLPRVVAGVPPDDLGPMGQRWGNPLYRWDAMAAEGYAWWTQRVKRALALADVFRIDHFRGFAGYFEIPAASPDAKQGQWLPGPGKPLFDAIESALGKLPIVAEDLGFITEDVHALRKGCGFPGMKILQFAFGGDGSHEFLPHNYDRDAVVYTGTHDNDTARGWWDHATDAERQFAGTYLACSEQDVHWAMIRACCNSIADLAVYPMQDVLGLPSAARMNTPGVLGPQNWSWRFRWEDVGSEPARVLKLLAKVSGRLRADNVAVGL